MPIGGTIEGMARREGVLVLENSSSGAGVAPEHTLYFDTLPLYGGSVPPLFRENQGTDTQCQAFLLESL